jgi:hypothetical protein
MYFDDCNNLDELQKKIKDFLIPKDEPPPPFIAPMSLRGMISKDPDGNTYIDRSDLQEAQAIKNKEKSQPIYIQARNKMLELQPNIPLPPIQPDPVVGLQTLLEFCLNLRQITDADSHQGEFGFHSKKPSE